MPNRTRRAKPKPGQADGWEIQTPLSLEDTLYKVLRDSYHRSDAAARAVARLEYQLALQLADDQQARDDPEMSVKESSSDLDEGSPSTSMLRGGGQVFDDREFVETFERLSFIRLVLDLTKLMGLTRLQPDLVQVLIDDRFRTRVSASSRSAPETNMVAGSDMSVLIHNIKKLAERRARSGPKPPKVSVVK